MKRGSWTAAALALTIGGGLAAFEGRAGPMLHTAAEMGNPLVVNALIAGGADPNARDELGDTALHAAARRGSLWAVDALIEAGADPKARDGRGRLPFDYAKGLEALQGKDLCAPKWPIHWRRRAGCGNEALRGTDAYWRLNEGRFE